MTTSAAAARNRSRGSASGASPMFIREWDAPLASTNPLDFPGYRAPASGEESVRSFTVDVEGVEAIWIDCDFSRHGGTMGPVAGERIVRAFGRATELGLPVLASVASGGARLQEGMFSLIQMARCASAVQRHRRAGLASAAFLRSPTTGGVWASWASLVDLRAAEPGATIGFGGPRVVHQVTGDWPPETSHTAESAYRHGLVDEIRPLEEMWGWFAEVVGSVHAAPLRLPQGRPSAPRAGSEVTPHEAVRACRSHDSPSGLEWAAWLTGSWMEIKGSDSGIRAGVAELAGRRVVVVVMDRHARHTPLGLPGPAAFRLARRAIELAGRWGLPVLTLVDTSGADPSPESEADAVAREIAEVLVAMAACPTPTVCLTVGEGGSGGAVALAHADRHLMLEEAVFAVIGPEAGARVLFRDAERADDLARAFRLTAAELVVDGLADEAVPGEVSKVLRAIEWMVSEAVPGDRERRVDRATARVITDRPLHESVNLL